MKQDNEQQHSEVQVQQQSVEIEEASLNKLSDKEINALVADFVFESSDNLKDINFSSIEGDVAMRVDETHKLFGKEFEETVSYIKDLIKDHTIISLNK